MARYRLERLLCIDTEWTCWDGDPPEGARPEIIEIGVVEAEVATMAVLREGRYLVRPTDSTVSAFCTGLTGLTQREVARQGRPLGDALASLAKAFGPAGKLTLAWGADWTGIESECLARGVANPFPRDNFHDVGKSFAILMGCRRRPGLSEALGRMGMGFEGRPHGAVTDALNTVRAYARLSEMAREAFPAPDEDAAPSP